MKKKYGLLILALLFILSINCLPMQAKSAKGTYYYTTSNSISGYPPHLTQARIKGNKLIIVGSVQKSKAGFYKGKIQNSRKYFFKLSKKAKFNYSDEYGYKATTKKSYGDTLKKMNGLGVVFKVKNGKVIWMAFHS